MCLSGKTLAVNTQTRRIEMVLLMVPSEVTEGKRVCRGGKSAGNGPWSVLYLEI